MAYAIAVAISDEGVDFMRSRGLLYLGLLPYFFGALINREGCWQRSEDHAESVGRTRSRAFPRAARPVLVLLVLGAGTAIYMLEGYETVKDATLILLGLVWGTMITRAWFIYQYQDSQAKQNRSDENHEKQR